MDQAGFPGAPGFSDGARALFHETVVKRFNRADETPRRSFRKGSGVIAEGDGA